MHCFHLFVRIPALLTKYWIYMVPSLLVKSSGYYWGKKAPYGLVELEILVWSAVPHVFPVSL